MAQRIITFFDTESTGLLPKRYKISNIDKLPHIVQLGAILVDADSFEEVDSLDILIKPEGYEIPMESTEIHGIKHEYAERYGRPLEDAVEKFDNFLDRSIGLVAHNIDFDSRMMGLCYYRTGRDTNKIYSMPKKCTMRAATPVCKMPGKFGDYKWPKLMECYTLFFGEEFEGAHDAMNDIRATVKVYQHLKKLKAI